MLEECFWLRLIPILYAEEEEKERELKWKNFLSTDNDNDSDNDGWCNLENALRKGEDDSYVDELTKIVREGVPAALRDKDGAKKALLVAKSFAPNAEAKWGDEGLESVFQDKSIHTIAVVLSAQYQLEIVLQALEGGKHVIQGKPVGPNVAKVRKAWSAYQALAKKNVKLPIWAVAENYRFESALIQFVEGLRQIMGVQVLIEAPMKSNSPYFASAWRCDPSFKGEFMLDGGVHFIVGLRMIMGCEVASVSGCVSHVDQTLPPPDNLSALILTRTVRTLGL